jgi:hypothetical protein
MTTTSPTSTTTGAHPADRLRALAGEQLARGKWSRDRLLAYQGERLRALIAHAVAASPYYREALGPDAASGEVPLRELPTLPKATLMDNFDRIVTDPRMGLAALEAYLSGPGADQPYLGRYRLFTTAGTTGLRGLFVYDVDEFAVWMGTCLRGMACWGLGPATRLAGIGSPGRGAAPGPAADRADCRRHLLGGPDGRHAPAHRRRLGAGAARLLRDHRGARPRGRAAGPGRHGHPGGPGHARGRRRARPTATPPACPAARCC